MMQSIEINSICNSQGTGLGICLENTILHPVDIHQLLVHFYDHPSTVCITLSNKERSPWKKVQKLIRVALCLLRSVE